MLHLSAKVKADRMAVLETQEPGQFVVSVLMSGHSNVGLRSNRLTAMVLSDARCSADYVNWSCASHGCMF